MQDKRLTEISSANKAKIADIPHRPGTVYKKDTNKVEQRFNAGKKWAAGPFNVLK
jgi:hypothetical protein